jgi:hypothetical protein
MNLLLFLFALLATSPMWFLVWLSWPSVEDWREAINEIIEIKRGNQ